MSCDRNLCEPSVNMISPFTHLYEPCTPWLAIFPTYFELEWKTCKFLSDFTRHQYKDGNWVRTAFHNLGLKWYMILWGWDAENCFQAQAWILWEHKFTNEICACFVDDCIFKGANFSRLTQFFFAQHSAFFAKINKLYGFVNAEGRDYFLKTEGGKKKWLICIRSIK